MQKNKFNSTINPYWFIDFYPTMRALAAVVEGALFESDGCALSYDFLIGIESNQLNMLKWSLSIRWMYPLGWDDYNVRLTSIRIIVHEFRMQVAACESNWQGAVILKHEIFFPSHLELAFNLIGMTEKDTFMNLQSKVILPIKRVFFRHASWNCNQYFSPIYQSNQAKNSKLKNIHAAARPKRSIIKTVAISARVVVSDSSFAMSCLRKDTKLAGL